MELTDNRRNLRATISDQGEVKTAQGITVGFINDDGNAGDTNEMFLGEVTTAGQVINSKDEILAKVNLGTAEVSNLQGSHVLTISRAGEITDSLDGYRGKFENFTYHKLRVIVSYIFFFDWALVDSTRSSLVVSESETLTLSSPAKSNDNSLKIRASEEKDIPVFAKENLSEYSELFDHFSNNCFIVAAMGNKPVGYLLWENSTLGYKHTWYIKQIFVYPELRKKIGIATALICHLIGMVKNNSGTKKLLSMIDKDNIPSLNLHIKNGFKVCGNLYFGERDFRILLINEIKKRNNKSFIII